MTLLEECISTLLNSKNKCEVLNNEATRNLINNFTNIFDITSWARIAWEKIKNKNAITSVNQIFNFLLKYDKVLTEPIYIIWDNANLPSIKCDLSDALKYIDDITAVSFDTWLYCPSQKWVIEFHHDGDITLGFENVL